MSGWWGGSARRAVVVAGIGVMLTQTGKAQELEPRRWSHLPMGTNFSGMAYAYTNGEIAFDPVLRLDDVTMDLHTVAASYIRTFDVFDHSTRIDLTQAYQNAY